MHGIFIYATTVDSSMNYVEGSNLGYVMKSAGGVNASSIKYNIVVDITEPFLSKGVIGVKYTNNVGIFKAGNNNAIGLLLMEDPVFPGSYSQNTIFKNNIIVDSRSSIDTIFISASSNDLIGCEIDYNIYYKENINQNHFAFIDGNWKTFVEWQALGYDTHSVLLSESQFNNLFTDYENGDYSLKTGSVAIGAGIALGELYNTGLDASTNWGNETQLPSVVTKPQPSVGGWDCGAYIH